MALSRAASLIVPVAFIVAVTATAPARAQQPQHDRGQNVQPAYEGWDRNPDGTYNLYFGYFNRNWEEEPDIPVGPNNAFSPGSLDRGQPTHFYPRRQMLLFKVVVPADFGKQELVWTVTHNGRTDRAVGWLAPFYELDNTVRRAQRGGSQRESTPEEVQAKPPSAEAQGAVSLTATVGTPLSLALLVKDDGLPGPAKRTFFQGDGTEAILATGPRRKTSAPQQDMVSAMHATKTGLAVTFLHYRGPAPVAFDPMTVPLDKMGGRAATKVTFDVPGTYVIRAVANDQIFTAPVDVTVVVK